MFYSHFYFANAILHNRKDQVPSQRPKEKAVVAQNLKDPVQSLEGKEANLPSPQTARSHQRARNLLEVVKEARASLHQGQVHRKVVKEALPNQNLVPSQVRSQEVAARMEP